MNHIIEIRSITLKPGTRKEFHELYLEKALPLLKRWNFDVVAHGPSLHDADSYYVIRRYESLSQRDAMEDAYYASDDWRNGPREAMISLIELYLDIVLDLDDVTTQGLRGAGNKFLEIRSYQLKPGTRDEFHRLFLKESYPLLQRWKVDVVAYGPSVHDENTYYLMRRFDSLGEREESESAFYSSDDWRQGPRQAVISLIEHYTEIVLRLNEGTVQGLRRILPNEPRENAAKIVKTILWYGIHFSPPG